MGLFSSSRSSSRSEAVDGRSMASDRALAAGANRGSVVNYQAAPIEIRTGGGIDLNWKAIGLLSAAAFILWKIPKSRRFIKKLVGVKNG